MDEDLNPAFDKLRRAAQGLPEVEESSSYGTPALKVRGKLICRVKDAETVVLIIPLDEKEMLLAAAPDLYFETDHYKGWPAILVWIDRVSLDELRHRLEQIWLARAPKALVKARQAAARQP